jgi:RNA polymerase sigma-70 factor (ECF subfamily)
MKILTGYSITCGGFLKKNCKKVVTNTAFGGQYRRKSKMATILQINPGLIHEAQVGNKDSMDRLAELVKERLYAYVYRLTLDFDITQDILQETVLFMIQSLNKLEHADSFWHWMFRTALGKVQHHYREQKRRKAVELSEQDRLRIHNRVSSDYNDGLTELLRKELSDAVFKAMKRLKLQYRNVLVLRCFENLEYAEIAQMLNVSELHSRVLFFRAKNSLRRQLAIQGFGGRHFLLALALFGLVTTSAKAASSTTVTTASLDVGFTASLVAVLSSKLGLAATTGLTAVALTQPVHTFLYVLAIICGVGLVVLLVCLADVFSS